MHAVGIYHNSFPYRNVIVSHSIILQSYSNMMTFISCIVIVAESGGGGLVFISDIVFDSSPDQRVGCDHCAQLTSAYLGMERCSIDNFHRGVCLGTCVVDNFNVGIGRCRSLEKGYD